VTDRETRAWRAWGDWVRQRAGVLIGQLSHSDTVGRFEYGAMIALRTEMMREGYHDAGWSVRCVRIEGLPGEYLIEVLNEDGSLVYPPVCVFPEEKTMRTIKEIDDELRCENNNQTYQKGVTDRIADRIAKLEAERKEVEARKSDHELAANLRALANALDAGDAVVTHVTAGHPLEQQYTVSRSDGYYAKIVFSHHRF